MKFAFVLFKYFPYGGLQRDCLSIAAACQARGHTVDVYTLSWEGDKPEGLNIHIIPVNEKRNHRKYEAFYQLISPLIHSNQYQAVAGFNKMPGLDVYFAADPCFQQKAATLRPWYYRFSARYRLFSKFEHAVFDPEINTELMMISEVEMQHFIRHYQTPAARFHMLPPGVKRDRMRPDNAGQIRAEFRAEFGFDDQQLICLMVGSDFRRKGLERSLYGLAALPDDIRQNTHLIVTGKETQYLSIGWQSAWGCWHNCIFMRGVMTCHGFCWGQTCFYTRLTVKARAMSSLKRLLQACRHWLPMFVVIHTM